MGRAIAQVGGVLGCLATFVGLGCSSSEPTSQGTEVSNPKMDGSSPEAPVGNPNDAAGDSATSIRDTDAAKIEPDAPIDSQDAAISDAPYFGQVPIDAPWSMGTYRGVYYRGFENEQFRPCGAKEVWEVGFEVAPVFPKVPAECTTTDTPSFDLCSFFLDVGASSAPSVNSSIKPAPCTTGGC
jgi:hypothetical protein